MNTRNATTPRQRYVVSITAENPLLQDTAAILAAQIGVVDVSLNQIVIFDRFLLVVEVVDELVPLVDDGHQLLEQQLLPQLLRFRLLPICQQIEPISIRQFMSILKNPEKS